MSETTPVIYILSGSERVRMYDTLVFKRYFMYIHWYYCVLHSIPLMYFTESLYVILSSRIYFEFYVYLWDIPRCVACWFYVFLCTLSEMTNKTCTIMYYGRYHGYYAHISPTVKFRGATDMYGVLVLIDNIVYQCVCVRFCKRDDYFSSLHNACGISQTCSLFHLF